uniref:60S acidic ribosomal protein P1 n=1 Tax=Spumella elongata TaxID=89044 RepID=A0A7S3HK71_9STRA
MTLSYQVTGADKDQLVTSLAAIVLSDSGADITAESLNAVIAASGNQVPAYYATLFASFIEKSGGLDKFFAGPSAGGAAAPAAAGAAAPAAAGAPAAAPAPKVEEVDALEGGMDMFGGGGGGGGDY